MGISGRAVSPKPPTAGRLGEPALLGLTELNKRAKKDAWQVTEMIAWIKDEANKGVSNVA